VSDNGARSTIVGAGKRSGERVTRKPAANVEVRVPELQVPGPGDGDNRVEVEEEQTE